MIKIEPPLNKKFSQFGREKNPFHCCQKMNGGSGGGSGVGGGVSATSI